MTGHPSNGWSEGQHVSPLHPERARLRTFCLLMAVLYFSCGALIAFVRPLGAALVDDSDVQFPVSLFGQELLCAVSLIALATLLLHIRGAIARDAAEPNSASRAGRTGRVLALAVTAVCAAGVIVVLLLPTAEFKAATVLVTIFVIGAALQIYTVLGKVAR